MEWQHNGLVWKTHDLIPNPVFSEWYKQWVDSFVAEVRDVKTSAQAHRLNCQFYKKFWREMVKEFVKPKFYSWRINRKFDFWSTKNGATTLYCRAPKNCRPIGAHSYKPIKFFP